LVGLALVAAAVAFIVFGGTEPGPAAAQGVDFRDMTIDEALELAAEEQRRVFVKFDAEWCTYCRTLDEEVLSTPEGGALTADVVAVRVDFDAEENRRFVERYVVLGLPTSLVLASDGTQVARIQGYHGRDSWITELEAGLTAEDPLPALRAALEAAPNDPEATLRLGEALLVRGNAEDGEALIERATWLSGPSGDVGAEALFILGRYYHRVRRDPRTARHVWRELAARYPDNDWAGGAFYWYAKAEAELGHEALGLEVLRRRALAHPDDAAIVSQWAELLVELELDDDAERRAALVALEPVTRAASGDAREELMTLARALAPTQ
jgi:thioredoxin-like negative regulator of GroEL